jgi:O-antigen/teichoic acid export membrane protein
MRSAEVDGHGGAQSRMGEVGGYLLALLLPALAGIVMLRSEIASVVLGEGFRAEAALLIPWVALTAVLANVKYHYFDMAFHVTRRMLILVATLLPATLLTAPLIYLFLRLWGLEGAAAGACLAFAASLACSWLAGRRLLAFPHAVGELARIAAAVGVMVAVLWAIEPLPGVIGLILHIAAGVAAYTIAALALNVLDSRKALSAFAGAIPSKLVRVS